MQEPKTLQQLEQEAHEAQKAFDDANGKLKAEAEEARKEGDPAKIKPETARKVLTAREALKKLSKLLEQARIQMVELGPKEVGARIAKRIMQEQSSDPITITFTGKNAQAVRMVLNMFEGMLDAASDDDQNRIGFALYSGTSTQYEIKMEDALASDDKDTISKFINIIASQVARDIFGPNVDIEPVDPKDPQGGK